MDCKEALMVEAMAAGIDAQLRCRAIVTKAATPMTPLSVCDTTMEMELEEVSVSVPVPRMLERKNSSLTSSTSSSQEDDDESDELDETDLRVKPMPMLPVCPVDDIAVEEEKRRRRSKAMKKEDARQHRRECAVAENLPSWTGGSDLRRKASDSPAIPAPQLRRDSMTIRQQYMKQLGLTMSRQDLERNGRRRKTRRPGIKIRLNDRTPHKTSGPKHIFQMIARWYNASSSDDSTDDDDNAETPEGSPSSRASSSPVSSGKGVRFQEEAELYYIPLHRDYSAHQRNSMWHSRVEFLEMVERNLDAVFEEMEQEFEAQERAEFLENEAMAREEREQRAFEAAEARAQHIQQQQQQQRQLQQQPPPRGIAPPWTRRAPRDPSRGASHPSHQLFSITAPTKVTLRARNSHDIRRMYLKNLGIQNSENSSATTRGGEDASSSTRPAACIQ